MKIPAAVPPFDPARADMRLPEAALNFRIKNRLTSKENLRRLNITAWLYRDKQGIERIQVNPNVTIAELLAQFGPADTRDAEVGIHSEGRAAEFFRKNPDFQVLQIFTERIPCPAMCAPLLGKYFTGVPVFYYYDPRSWSGTKSAADILAGIYAITGAEALAQLKDQFERLTKSEDGSKGEHAMKLNMMIRDNWNPMGPIVRAFNPVSTPKLDIWDDVEDTLDTVRDLLSARNGAKAAAFLAAARLQYLVALKQYVRWSDGLDIGALKTNMAVVSAAATIIFLAGGEFLVAAEAPEGAAALAKAEQTLTRIEFMSEQADNFIRIAGSEGEPEMIIEEVLRSARALP